MLIAIALIIGGVLASFMFDKKTSVGAIPRGHCVTKKEEPKKTPNDIVQEANQADALWEMEMRARMAQNQAAMQAQQNALAQLQAQQQKSLPRFDESGMSLPEYLKAIQEQQAIQQRQDKRRSQNRDLNAQQFMNMVNPKWGRNDD